jgi:hypothetical protein
MWTTILKDDATYGIISTKINVFEKAKRIKISSDKEHKHTDMYRHSKF